MIAMLLAGGQGSRLGVLTAKVAKPAVAFGGKYRIIDFPLSNCINSGIDTVGVLTQYQPLRLNTHIGIRAATGILEVFAIMMVRSINLRPVCGSTSSGNSVKISTTSLARSPQAAIITISASACLEIAC